MAARRQALGQLDDRLGATPPHRRGVEDVEIAGAPVGVVDDRQEPALVVTVAVVARTKSGFAGCASRAGVPGRDVADPGRTSTVRPGARRRPARPVSANAASPDVLLPQSISRQYPYRNISPAQSGRSVDTRCSARPRPRPLDSAPTMRHRSSTPEAAPDRREPDSRRTDDGGRQVDGLSRLRAPRSGRRRARSPRRRSSTARPSHPRRTHRARGSRGRDRVRPPDVRPVPAAG